jgi:hypothetical protein
MFAIHSEKRDLLRHAFDVMFVITGEELTKATPASAHE